MTSTRAAAVATTAVDSDRERPVLLSVNVGMPKNVAWRGKTVYTGVWKHPVAGPVMARRLNLDGDGQGDPGGHGGEQRAVLVYQIGSYRHWARYFGRDDFGYGMFGENLTVDGLGDDQVCIGDRYRIGDAEFEVTQPRVTCYRVGLRLGEPELPALLVSHHRPGFYMRVIAEGHLQAGDPIIKTRTGPHALTVADIDALLYLPGRDPAQLRRAVQIPALSPGWQGSFRDLLAAADGAGPAPLPGPAWAGFRQLRVSRVARENPGVSSIYLAAADGTALPAAQAGQYLTLRIPGAGQPAPVRSYSLSSAPGARAYRISVKHEPHGAASSYLTTRLRPGAVLDTAAPRGDFVLDTTTSPVLLISAGIGLTPVLAMLHELAARRSEREVWWIHGARSPREHPLAAEAHALLAALPHAREHVFYSAATPGQRPGGNAAAGRLTKDKLATLGLPASASAYLCGPAPFMADMTDALTAIGIDPARIHSELFGALPPVNPGLAGQTRQLPHQPPGPAGTGPQVTFARSGITTRFPAGGRSVLELAEACDIPARWACRTGVCTPAPRPCSPATSPIPRAPWNPRPAARCSSAAPGPAPASSWTCRARNAMRTPAQHPANRQRRKAGGIRGGRSARAGRGRRHPGHRPAAGHLCPAPTEPSQHPTPALARNSPGDAPGARLGHPPPAAPWPGVPTTSHARRPDQGDEMTHGPIAVSGASGAVGRHVARGLAVRGLRQRLIARDPARLEGPPAAEVRTIPGYHARAEVRRALDGVRTFRRRLRARPTVTDRPAPRAAHSGAVGAALRTGPSGAGCTLVAMPARNHDPG